jgi:hypothetical protein
MAKSDVSYGHPPPQASQAAAIVKAEMTNEIMKNKCTWFKEGEYKIKKNGPRDFVGADVSRVFNIIYNRICENIRMYNLNSVTLFTGKYIRDRETGNNELLIVNIWVINSGFNLWIAKRLENIGPNDPNAIGCELFLGNNFCYENDEEGHLSNIVIFALHNDQGDMSFYTYNPRNSLNPRSFYSYILNYVGILGCNYFEFNGSNFRNKVAEPTNAQSYTHGIKLTLNDAKNSIFGRVGSLLLKNKGKVVVAVGTLITYHYAPLLPLLKLGLSMGRGLLENNRSALIEYACNMVDCGQGGIKVAKNLFNAADEFNIKLPGANKILAVLNGTKKILSFFEKKLNSEKLKDARKSTVRLKQSNVSTEADELNIRYFGSSYCANAGSKEKDFMKLIIDLCNNPHKIKDADKSKQIKITEGLEPIFDSLVSDIKKDDEKSRYGYISINVKRRAMLAYFYMAIQMEYYRMDTVDKYDSRLMKYFSHLKVDIGENGERIYEDCKTKSDIISRIKALNQEIKGYNN